MTHHSRKKHHHHPQDRHSQGGLRRRIRAGLQGLTVTFLALAMPLGGKAEMLGKMKGRPGDAAPHKQPYDHSHDHEHKPRRRRHNAKARHTAGPS